MEFGLLIAFVNIDPVQRLIAILFRLIVGTSLIDFN